jgi:hypothetical protein
MQSKPLVIETEAHLNDMKQASPDDFMIDNLQPASSAKAALAAAAGSVFSLDT